MTEISLAEIVVTDLMVHLVNVVEYLPSNYLDARFESFHQKVFNFVVPARYVTNALGPSLRHFAFV